MAKIEIAEEAGMCFGVARALELAEKAAREAEGPVSTLGPLIHNPQVVADLERQGVGVATTPKGPAGSTLIIRAHGVVPEAYEEAKAAGVHIVDATCPYVMKVHALAEKLHREGYAVLVLGERGHAEVEGTLGHAPGALVVNSANDVESAFEGGLLTKKIGLVVQTTQTQTKLQEVVSALAPRAEELRVYNTICEATENRQKAAATLASGVDVMVVIGGRNSANTTHLAEICSAHCARTYHIEDVGELNEVWFQNVQRIGITAGASTPQSQIEAVRQKIESFMAREES